MSNTVDLAHGLFNADVLISSAAPAVLDVVIPTAEQCRSASERKYDEVLESQNLRLKKLNDSLSAEIKPLQSEIKYLKSEVARLMTENNELARDNESMQRALHPVGLCTPSRSVALTARSAGYIPEVGWRDE